MPCPLRLLLAALALLIAGCPQPAPPPAPGGSSQGAVDAATLAETGALAEAYVRSGGQDTALLLPSPAPALLQHSRTTPIDFQPSAILSVEHGRSGLTGPGQATELQSHTFVVEGKEPDGSTIRGSNTVYAIQPLGIQLDDGSKREVVVFFRPHEGAWRVVPPPPSDAGGSPSVSPTPGG